MKKTLSRRDALKLAVAGAAASTVACSTTPIQTQKQAAVLGEDKAFRDPWKTRHDRSFLGGEVWANPMEDWCIKDGAAQSTFAGGNRSVHSLCHQLVDVSQPFEISLVVQRLEKGAKEGGAGIRLGIKSELNDYRSNAFVQKGFDTGLLNRRLVLGHERKQLPQAIEGKAVKLVLKGEPQLGAVSLTLSAKDVDTGKPLGELSLLVAAEEILGNVAIVSNFTLGAVNYETAKAEELGSIYRFSDWTMSGAAFSDKPEQQFGPILWTMYTLSDGRDDSGFTLKLTALLGPMGKQDNDQVELQVWQSGTWQTISTETLDPEVWVATFTVPNWLQSSDHRYRVFYQEQLSNGQQLAHSYEGIIRQNPEGRPLRMAGLTCQNDYGFPYAPVAENVVKLDPDLLYFSGDQIYESHGGYWVIRQPTPKALLNYLRKYYQFGWAFGDAMRNAPTVCLPDDHDVFQGNLWGEGGAAMKNTGEDQHASVSGGYIEPIDFVNAVHRTIVGHHPAPYDPTPAARGMTVYYGELVYGNVGFAILADRQWKSGPERLDIKVGVTGQDEDPLAFNPNYDAEGLELLGKRQEDFLAAWAKDWRGHELKAVLSQTVFAGIATHQPRPDNYIKYDFDGSGWPASARNRAVALIRDAKALHICGDTHLGTLSQYGVDQPRDANGAFCTPAIAAGWPRWWTPDVIGKAYNNRPSHGLANTGEYQDSFGNEMYVYAVGNPVVGKSKNRYVKAHEKASGFGMITFDTVAKTYTMDAYRFLIDVNDGSSSNQFPGWPVTVHQDENAGQNRLS